MHDRYQGCAFFLFIFIAKKLDNLALLRENKKCMRK